MRLCSLREPQRAEKKFYHGVLLSYGQLGVSRRKKKGALGLCRNADQLVFCNIHLMYPIFV
jgi:hypothetical protein